MAVLAEAIDPDPSEKVIFAFDYSASPAIHRVSHGVAAEIARYAEISWALEDLPLARMHRYLRNEPNVCALWIIRASGFEPHYHWLRVTTVPMEFAEYKRTDATSQELDQPPILPRGTSLEMWAEEAEVPFVGVGGRQQIIDMLLRKRSARWIDIRPVIETILAENPSLKMEHVRTLALVPSWLACSPQTPEPLRNKLANAWDDALRNGDLRLIFEELNLEAFLPDQEAEE